MSTNADLPYQVSVVVMSVDLEPAPGFKSPPISVLPVGTWVSYIAFLSLSFYICENEDDNTVKCM